MNVVATRVSRLLSFDSITRFSFRSSARILCSSSSSPSMASTGEGLASSLWKENTFQALMALYHPFVVSLAAGMLNIQSFRHYVAQDAFFLHAFANAYGHARDNIEDESYKLAIDKLLQAVMEELQLHSSYAQSWGVDLNVESKPNKATLKYTDFLLVTAEGGGALKKDFLGGQATVLDRQRLAAFTIGAMTPCMRLYAFLGQEITKHLDNAISGTPYWEWIQTYSSEAFESSALQIEWLLDKLAENLGHDDIGELKSLYSQALSLELDFFSAQPNCHCMLLPLIRRQGDGSNCHYLVMTDFDLTCSLTNSCTALADISVQTALQKEATNPNAFPKSSSDLKRKWQFLEKSYAANYAKALTVHENLVLTKGGQRRYNPDGLRLFLEQLSLFEIQANAKLIAEGVFMGLDLEEVRRAGGQVELQEGCSHFLKRVSMLSNVNAHVVSVCWSRSFIEGALAKDGVNSIAVHANELKANGLCTTGDLVRLIETPFDKERVMAELLRKVPEGPEPVVSVYIGDSVTDLLCLLKAHLGIVVGSSSTLRRVAEEFGVSIVPLYKGLLERVKLGGSERWQHVEGVLYSVTSWHEIHAFMIAQV